MTQRQHTCPHPRDRHRHGRGRCMVAGCPCLQAPPPAVRPARPEPRHRGIVTVDASGLVVGYQPPARRMQPGEKVSERERLERMLWDRIVDAGLPLPAKQFLWARPERMYRSDFAYVPERILLEVQGGIWARDPGRHNRGSGYQADCARSNLAALLGWRLLQFTEQMIKSGDAVETIGRALEPRVQDVQLSLTGACK